MNETRIATVGLIVVAIIAIWGLFSPGFDKTALLAELSSQLAGVTNYDQLDVTDGYQVDGTTVIDGDGDFTIGGTSGTETNALKYGSCTIWAPATTIAATSTQQIVCQGGTDGGITAITGITADSVCTLTMASSTNTTLASLVVGGASASSTDGNIVARLVNLTGDTFTWTANASSSPQWNYDCKDPA